MIELDPYNSAILLADVAFKDPIKEKRIPPHFYEKEGRRTRIIPNPEYNRETQRIRKWEKENRKRKFIITYLKEKYPNTNYAERYEQDNKWNKSLMYPTEESKKCEYLHEDGRHCTMKRDETSCYTCCFVCSTPAMCQHTNCPLLPEDRKPKKGGD